MTAATIHELGQERFMLDLGFRGSPGLIASFLLPGDDGWTLLETGPTTCKAQLLDGLAAAGVERTEVARVVVTHIHLDHAGGVGALLPELPRATVYVHRLGVPHLIDPTRLEASARQAWGAQMDALFGGLAPVPAAPIRRPRGPGDPGARPAPPRLRGPRPGGGLHRRCRRGPTGRELEDPPRGSPTGPRPRPALQQPRPYALRRAAAGAAQPLWARSGRPPIPRGVPVDRRGVARRRLGGVPGGSRSGPDRGAPAHLRDRSGAGGRPPAPPVRHRNSVLGL